MPRRSSSLKIAGSARARVVGTTDSATNSNAGQSFSLAPRGRSSVGRRDRKSTADSNCWFAHRSNVNGDATFNAANNSDAGSFSAQRQYPHHDGSNSWSDALAYAQTNWRRDCRQTDS